DKPQPLTEQQLVPGNRLGGQGVNGARGDFARQRVHRGENRHGEEKKVEGVQSNQELSTDDLATDQRREAWAQGLVVPGNAEQDDKGCAYRERDPKDFLPARFLEGQSRHHPDAHHSPPSSPTTCKNRSSRESRWGVTS